MSSFDMPTHDGGGPPTREQVATPATVLVVDDSVPAALLVQTHLERAGYRVVLAHDGVEALARVAESPPDLIITDVMMPQMDGFEVCDALKSDERTWFIPIILLTALDQSRARIRGIDAGADDFLTKPFNREELLARVRSLLRLKFAREELQVERNRLALLYRISQGINSDLALDQVLSSIVTHTREALQANMCSILTCDERREESSEVPGSSDARTGGARVPPGVCQFISRRGSPPAMTGSVAPSILHDGLAGWVIQHRDNVLIADARADDRWLVLPSDVEPVQSIVAAPVMIGRQVLGVLLATHAEASYFNEDHLALLVSIAAQAAVTVRNSRLYEMEQRRRREMEMLQRAGAALSAELNWDTLLRLVVHEAMALFGVQAATLMLIDETGELLTISAWQGLPERYVRREQVRRQEVGALLAGGTRSFQLPNLGQVQFGRADLLAREGVVAQISLALVASGQFLGLLNLYLREGDELFDAARVKVGETFAQQAAVALANARLLENMREERGKLSAVVRSTKDAVLVVDDTGTLILANPAAETTVGFKLSRAIGEPIARHAPLQFLQVFSQVAARGKPASDEVALDDGRALYVSVSPVAGVGHVAVVQDVTPIKELAAMRLRTEQTEHQRLRGVFERYVGPELVDQILAQETGMLQRRERRHAVILFADLRGFMRLTFSHPAQEVIEVLNEYFQEMVDIVHAQHGAVFDLAGDELMVAFNAPFDQQDAVERAVRTAGEMQAAFDRLRTHWRDERGAEVGLGIGIDRGTVVMGSIGAARHMNFGLVGNAV
ncbi:MAG TPA: response regulator, partial [Anaerolineae bacterium]|nr:response regulator [Anaerolineae bacterium]